MGVRPVCCVARLEAALLRGDLVWGEALLVLARLGYSNWAAAQCGYGRVWVGPGWVRPSRAAARLGYGLVGMGPG